MVGNGFVIEVERELRKMVKDGSIGATFFRHPLPEITKHAKLYKVANTCWFIMLFFYVVSPTH